MPAFGEHRKPYYPGLGRVETAIWRRWLEDNEQDYEHFEYNVRVGEGVRPLRGDPPADPEMRARQDAAWIQWTQKRIDVVAWGSPGTTIIEIKERLDVKSLGQLLLYDDLFAKQRPLENVTRLLVLCRYVGADLAATFDNNDIEVAVVPVSDLK